MKIRSKYSSASVVIRQKPESDVFYRAQSRFPSGFRRHDRPYGARWQLFSNYFFLYRLSAYPLRSSSSIKLKSAKSSGLAAFALGFFSARGANMNLKPSRLGYCFFGSRFQSTSNSPLFSTMSRSTLRRKYFIRTFKDVS